MAQQSVWKCASVVSTTFILAALLAFPTSSPAAERFETPVGFSVSPTGAANFNIPIEAPPGTAGLTPSLSLSYNSQGGIGMLGVGWGLNGLSAIYRCGRTIIQDSVNSGVGYTANDRFCMDGQRLVVVANASGVTGVYGANLTEYRTERESFTRIVSYGTTGSGPTYFIAQTKAGQTIEFGNTTDSRVEAQGKTDIRVWAVNKVSDTVGNYIKVSYTEDGTTLRAANANGDYYPLRVDYTGNDAPGGVTANAVAPYNSIRFVYETRADNTLSYVGGSIIKNMLRMTHVKTYAKVNGADTPVKDYQLGYLNNALPNNASRLVSVTECLGDDSSCLPATALGWITATGTTSFAAGSAWGSGTGQIYASADFNGDGLADLVYENTTTIPSLLTTVYVQYSTGTGFSAPVTLVSGNFAATPITTGDVNGDGKADVILGNGKVYLSAGSSFAAGVAWGSGTGQIYASADFNGDGLADLVYENTTTVPSLLTTVSVQYSTGTGFSAPVTLVSGNFAATPITTGDVNGDGKADVILGSGKVYLSMGSSFATGVSWSTSSSSAQIISSADLNGDGLADLVYENTIATPSLLTIVSAQYSTGIGFGPSVTVVSGSYASTPMIVGDVSGDGKADVILGNNTVYLSQTATSDLLNSVTTGLGNITSIVYQLISNSAVYSPDTGGVFPVRDVNVKMPLSVVSSVTVPNGIGGTRSSNYKYYGAKTHLTGGGFLGFRQYDVTDASSLIKTSTVFTQNYPYQGLVTSIIQYQSNGSVLHSVVNTPSVWTYSDTVLPITNNGSKHHFPAITHSVEITNELTGALVTQMTTDSTYDTTYGIYGNVYTVNTATNDGFIKLITNTYAAPNLTKWYIGQLIHSTVQSTTPYP